MKVAVVGSKSLRVDDLAPYLPEGVTMLISGGTTGIDSCVREYAEVHDIPLTEIKPNYARYRGSAAIAGSRAIVDAADEIVAIWDGLSHGTWRVICDCEQLGKKVSVHILKV